MTEGAGGKVGFVGLGNIGRPMAERLAESGFQLACYDIRPDAKAHFRQYKGIQLAETVAEVCANAEVLILSLPSSRQVAEVIEGAGGVIQSGKFSGTLVDTTTSLPTSTRKIAARLQGCGIGMVDAAVSGGLKRAREGTLTIMVGGERPELRIVQPVLETLGTIYHMGHIGSGHTTKLINNAILGVNMAIIAEALSLGASAGLDVAKLVDVILKSTGKSQVLEARGWRIVSGNYAEPQATLNIIQKDLDAALAVADEFQHVMPIGALAAQLYRIGSSGGYGNQDYAAIARVYELLNTTRTSGAAEPT